jgi:hypothetical protein
MYPKQPQFSRNNSRSSKRDQVARLLITKFRNKFNINLTDEQPLDLKIQEHVNSIIKSDEPLTEKQLVQLSRKLGQVVE